MSLENHSPKTEITYYGKKVFHLDKNLARKIELEQTLLNCTYDDIEEESSNTLH